MKFVAKAVGEQDGNAERVEVMEHGVIKNTYGEVVGKMSAESATSAKIVSELIVVNDVGEQDGAADRVESIKHGVV